MEVLFTVMSTVFNYQCIKFLQVIIKIEMKSINNDAVDF